MSAHLRILLIEDSEDDARLVLREVQRSGYEVDSERVETAEAMLATLERQAWDLIICDFSLPRFSAPKALELLKESGIDLPFIIVSGTIGEESAVTALKAGAHDFIIKGNFARLIPAIERELKEAEIRRAQRQHERELEAIAAVNSTLRTTKTLDELLARLLDQALTLVKGEAGSIWLYDLATGRVELILQQGWSHEHTTYKAGEGIPGMVIRLGKAMIARDFHSDPQVPQEDRDRLPKGMGGACI